LTLPGLELRPLRRSARRQPLYRLRCCDSNGQGSVENVNTNNYNFLLHRYLYNRRHIGPPLWSSGQSSWLQIQISGFDFRRYQIFSDVVGLERGPLSLVSTIEELLERKSSGSGLQNREYGHRNLSRSPRDTLYPEKLAITSPTSGVRWVGIVCSWTQATEFFSTFRNCVCFHLHLKGGRHLL
jgi:hypothetical protein